MKKHKNKKAFSLAEVLVTFGVIGVIAMMTVPSIMSKMDERVMIVKLRTLYTTLNKAFESAVSRNGYVSFWGLSENSSKDKDSGEHNLKDRFWDLMIPYLNVLVYESAENQALVTKQWKILSLKDKSVTGPFYPQIRLENGICITPFWTSSKTCEDSDVSGPKYCGSFGVDLNCEKSPNMEGKDVFHFYVTRDKLLPTGSQEASKNSYHLNFEEYCAVPEKELAGRGCTAWVIYNGNMDYLRCGPELSWDGARKCPK